MPGAGLVWLCGSAMNFQSGQGRGVAGQVSDESKCAGAVLEGQASLLITAFKFPPLARDIRDASAAVSGLRFGFGGANVASYRKQQEE
jgi:hypothetical protein